jgi:Bacterial Ig-like domain
VLAREPDLNVVDEAGNELEAIELCRSLGTDLVLKGVGPTELVDAARAATGVSRTTMVVVSFSEEMAPTSIANLTTHVSKTFKLQMYKRGKWVAIPARVNVSNNDTTATLDPYGLTEGAVEKPLAANKKFRVTITTGVTDAQGNPIARNFAWTYKTGSS